MTGTMDTSLGRSSRGSGMVISFGIALLVALALALITMAGPADASPCPDCGGGGGGGGDDITAPETTIDSSPPTLTNQTSATFTFSSSEENSTFECRLDLPGSTGTFQACGSATNAGDVVSKTYSGLTTNGGYTFHVRATDASTNTDASPATRTWTVDTVAPPPPTINTRPPELSNSRTATWTFSSEPGATFLCSINSTTSFVGCSSGQSFTVTSDGLHTFRVRARDAAGNVGGYAEDSWTVDTRLPVASIQTGPSGLTNSRSASFTFSSDEAGSFQCRLKTSASPEVPFEGCGSGTSSGKSYSGLADGSYTFEVRAIDQAGNVGSAVTRSFTVDGTAPVVNITGGPEEGSTSNSRSPSFTFTASEPADYSCKLDGAAEFTACSSPQEYSDLADGPHTFSVKGRDAAGNESAPVVRSWTVDATPPSLSITSGPSDGAVFGPGSTQAWTFDAGDASEVQCKVALVGTSASYGNCNGGNSSHSVSGLSEGSYTFSVRAKDSVGNEATATRRFTIDATAPTGTIKINNGAAYATSAEVNLTLSATDTGSGLSSMRLRNEDTQTWSAWKPYATSTQWTLSSTDGSKSVYVQYRDRAGNVSAAARDIITLDTTAPAVTRVVPADKATGIAPATNVYAFFSEAMRGGSISPKTFKLYEVGSTDPVVAQVSYDPARKKATLDPESNLKRGTVYRAVISRGVRDLAGNRMAAGEAWIFKTR